ncbi:MAG: NUDIX hydrolase [Lachnospiraceae bacterium]
MILTTICYIEKDDSYLMLHRIKKKNDINHDKWIGVGGKFELNESPEECMLREVKEETGLSLTDYRLRGIITFILDGKMLEYMFLYTASAYTGEIIECNEGELVWVPKSKLEELTLWEGDKIFFRLLEERQDVFSLKLHYSPEDVLLEAKLDNMELPLDK